MLKYLQEVWPFSWFYERKHTKVIVLPPSSPTLIPTFLTPNELADGQHFYNPDFYTTEQTAMDVMQRFNALVAFKRTVKDGEGYAPEQWFVRFDDGLEVNAGQLAKFFACYPEEKYPGIAGRFGLGLINYMREMRERNVN